MCLTNQNSSIVDTVTLNNKYQNYRTMETTITTEVNIAIHLDKITQPSYSTKTEDKCDFKLTNYLQYYETNRHGSTIIQLLLMKQTLLFVIKGFHSMTRCSATRCYQVDISLVRSIRTIDLYWGYWRIGVKKRENDKIISCQGGKNERQIGALIQITT